MNTYDFIASFIEWLKCFVVDPPFSFFSTMYFQHGNINRHGSAMAFVHSQYLLFAFHRGINAATATYDEWNGKEFTNNKFTNEKSQPIVMYSEGLKYYCFFSNQNSIQSASHINSWHRQTRHAPLL